MQVYVVGFDPVDNPNGGVGGFDWFYLLEGAIAEMTTHAEDSAHGETNEDGYFVWFRKLKVDDDMSRDDITDYIENLIRDFGSDGDWVPVKEND